MIFAASPPALGSSGNSEATNGLCGVFLLNEIPFDSLFPDIGPSLIELFPFHMSARTTFSAVTSIVRRNNKDRQSKTDSESNVVRPPFAISPQHHIAELLAEGQKPENRLNLALGPLGSAKSDPTVIGLTQELQRENPRYRHFIIGIRNIDEFWHSPPLKTFEGPGWPITVLPREWQRTTLERLLNRRGQELGEDEILKLLARSDNTWFSILGRPPRQNPPPPQTSLDFHGPLSFFAPGLGRDNIDLEDSDSTSYLGDLNPDLQLRVIIGHLRRYYFGARKVLDPDDLMMVMRKHVYFKIQSVDDV